jgi:hypothetical protein
VRGLDLILDEVTAFIRRYVVLTDYQASTIALWITHAHFIDAFDVSPPLAIVSPEKRSGKTLLLDVLELLTPRPWRAISPSEAVIYRYIDAQHPTLLLDEVDTIFGKARENTEGLRALLNAGNKRGTRVPRCVGTSLDIHEFSVFGPKVLAGIGELPDTVADRSLIVTMRRRTKAEPVQRFRGRKASPVAFDLRDELAEWSSYVVDELHASLEVVAEFADDGAPLAGLNDRAFEQCWEPLLAVAHLAGPSWLARAIVAAQELSDVEDQEQETNRTRLLRDIRAVFDALGVDRISSQRLANELAEDESSPWADWFGHNVTPRAVAKLLAPFGIRPKGMRLHDGTTPRGYFREAFEDAFARYLPDLTATPATTAWESQKPLISDRNTNGHVADAELAANPHGYADVAVVAVENPDIGAEAVS